MIGTEHRPDRHLVVAGFLIVLTLTSLAIIAPGITVSMMGISGGIVILWKLRTWRAVVATSFTASIIRGLVDAPDVVAYAIQFGPIAVGIIALLVNAKRSPLRRVDTTILVALGGIAGAAVLSSITSVAPGQSFLQSGLLVVMVSFIGLTFSLRWTTSKIVRGDLTLVFALICAAQLAGIVGAVWGHRTMIGDYGRFQGVLTNANYAGLLAAVAIPLAVFVYASARHHTLAVFGAAISLTALIWSGSRGSALAVVVGFLALFLISTGRKMLVPVAWAGGLATVLALGFRPETIDGAAQFFNRDDQGSDITSGRTRLYEEMLERWQHDPWLGTGYRTIETYRRDGYAGHNTYLSVLTETGVIGAGVLAVLITCIVIAGRSHAIDRTLIGSGVADPRRSFRGS